MADQNGNDTPNAFLNDDSSCHRETRQSEADHKEEDRDAGRQAKYGSWRQEAWDEADKLHKENESYRQRMSDDRDDYTRRQKIPSQADLDPHRHRKNL